MNLTELEESTYRDIERDGGTANRRNGKWMTSGKNQTPLHAQTIAGLLKKNKLIEVRPGLLSLDTKRAEVGQQSFDSERATGGLWRFHDKRKFDTGWIGE